MQCPTCNSENVQKLQIIHEAGTQKIQTTSRHSGAGFSARSGLMGGGGTTSTSGQAQSIAARKAAPPAKKSYKLTVIIGILALLAFMSFGHGAGLAIGVILLAIAILLGYRAYQYNAGPWQERYGVWTRSWQCNKCGNVYAA